MIIHPFLQDKPPYLKFLYFVLIVVVSLFFVNFLGMLLAVPIYGKGFIDSLSGVYDYTDPTVISKLKYLQIVNELALFIVPVVIFALFAGKSIPDYLKLNRKINLLPLLLGISLIIAGLPFINLISEFNGNMSLPEQLAGVEKWMRASETEAGELTNAFLSTTTAGGLVLNIVMIAILPAVGEEFFFRGVLQRLFSEWFRNVHVAIIVTAFIFSAIHFQFYGFIPRFLLGMFLGYVFYWSGTLWLPIIIHFINNGLAVAVAFLSTRGLLNIDFESFGSSDSWFVNISSMIICGGLMFLLYRLRRLEVGRQKTEVGR